jgi:hypothetical protein
MPELAIRPMSVGEVLDTSFGIYRRLFVPLAVVAVLTQAVPTVWALYDAARGADMTANMSLLLVRLTVTFVLSSIGAAASTFIVSESYLGRSLSAGDALQRAVPFIGRLLALSLLTWLLVAGQLVVASVIAAVGLAIVGPIAASLFLLALPGVAVVLTGLILGTPAMVIENQPRATVAMSRSWALTRGSRLRIFGVILVAIVLMMVPWIALGSVGAMFMSRAPETLEGTGTPLVLIMLVSVIQVLLYPLLYVGLTVLYYDARVRHEAFDLEILAASLGRA